MINNKKKKNIIILFMLLLGLSVGFALLQANLTINGSSKIKGSSWDIHFENLNVTNGSVELSTGDVAATIQSSTTDISYTVTLNKPGDFYEFTVDAVNDGSIDGMIESVTSKLNDEPITTLPYYLNYSVTYATNDEIQSNHLLKVNTSETYKVRIEFKKDITENDLPTTAQTLKLDFGVVYIQADKTATEVAHPKYVYTINKEDNNLTNLSNNSIWLNQEYPETIPYFETPREALSALRAASSKDIPFYLKHKVENEIVTESYVEFIITETFAEANSGMVPGTYTLRGEKTYDFDISSWLVDESYISPYYETNKEAIKTAFGYATNQGRCSESGTGRLTYFECRVPGLGVSAFVDGYVRAFDIVSSSCSVSQAGQVRCFW